MKHCSSSQGKVCCWILNSCRKKMMQNKFLQGVQKPELVDRWDQRVARKIILMQFRQYIWKTATYTSKLFTKNEEDFNKKESESEHLKKCFLAFTL